VCIGILRVHGDGFLCPDKLLIETVRLPSKAGHAIHVDLVVWIQRENLLSGRHCAIEIPFGLLGHGLGREPADLPQLFSGKGRLDQSSRSRFRRRRRSCSCLAKDKKDEGLSCNRDG
jgi:hypothetical protein